VDNVAPTSEFRTFATSCVSEIYKCAPFTESSGTAFCLLSCKSFTCSKVLGGEMYRQTEGLVMLQIHGTSLSNERAASRPRALFRRLYINLMFRRVHLILSYDLSLWPAVRFINNTWECNKKFQMGKKSWIKTHPWADTNRTFCLPLMYQSQESLHPTCPNLHVGSSQWNMQVSGRLISAVWYSLALMDHPGVISILRLKTAMKAE
jgi:hypothetical protein